jgi:acyl-CoA dehydrogenase
MAIELAASNAALSSLKITNKLMPNLDDIAILKIRTGIAAGKLIAISHQVHGAMGFTKEYELSYFTKNLNSWRNDFGNETYWQNILGKNFLEKTNLSLWEYLTN